jgi:hypothetical protein
MSRKQKQVLVTLVIIALGYFILSIFPNWHGAETRERLSLQTDESIIYPILTEMFRNGTSLPDVIHHWIVYEDYHYGFPFYLYSALVVLPVKLANWNNFPEMIQVNLLLLRQFVNVLPITMAALLLVFLQTRYKSWTRSIALFLFLLSIKGVVRSNLQWWHPDSLGILAVVLTFFFLDRDQMRFGRNFFLAAFCCGMATAIKLFGPFFVLTIAGYILYGLLQRKIVIKKAVYISVLFILVMGAASIFSNPFLFLNQPRQRYFEIQEEIRYNVTHGYENDTSGADYSTGFSAWAPYLDRWYGLIPFLIFAFILLVINCIWGDQKSLNWMILGWVIPYAAYLIFFVAVKPDHYWLPVMVPFLSAVFPPPSWWNNSKKEGIGLVQKGLYLVSWAFVAVQFALNMTADIPHYLLHLQ